MMNNEERSVAFDNAPKPYSFRKFYFPFWFYYRLTYEGEDIGYFCKWRKEAEQISHLLNCAFREGINYFTAIHECKK